MALTENEFVQPCHDSDFDAFQRSGHQNQPPLQDDNGTQRNISSQFLSAQVSEQPYDSVTTDHLELQDCLNDELWGSENVASAALCASRTVAPVDANSRVPGLPSSRSGSVAENEDISQGNTTPLSHESFTMPPLLSNTSWESAIQSAGSDFDHSTLNANPPKIGTRFSRESSKILKNWFDYHYNYPYPSKEETETLQGQTGLSKTQIKNWLANNRRREKMHQSTQSSRRATPVITSNKVPIDIPRRPDTPTVQTRNDHQAMGPLERWVDSPPESEPATVTAIAKAVQRATSSRSKSLNESLDLCTRQECTLTRIPR